MRFYLGTHIPAWLGQFDVPLFISARRLAARKSLPHAIAPWALDSGGFSELTLFGAWRTTAQEYASAVKRYADEIGQLAWASIQDWMCEPAMIKHTGLSVREHQRRSVDSYLRLRELQPVVNWLPVVQGYQADDYMVCVEMYSRAGVDLEQFAVVGLGSVCRRQSTRDAERIVVRLSQMGLHLHGFGFRTTGLRSVARLLASADSMAWSYEARYLPPMPNHRHARCNNCPAFALSWYSEVLRTINLSKHAWQLDLL